MEFQVDERLEKVLKMVRDLQEIPVGELRRGPFLAVVEVEKRRLLLRKKFGGEDQVREQSAVLADSIRAFFERLVSRYLTLDSLFARGSLLWVVIHTTLNNRSSLFACSVFT